MAWHTNPTPDLVSQ